MLVIPSHLRSNRTISVNQFSGYQNQYLQLKENCRHWFWYVDVHI